MKKIFLIIKKYPRPTIIGAITFVLFVWLIVSLCMPYTKSSYYRYDRINGKQVYSSISLENHSTCTIYNDLNDERIKAKFSVHNNILFINDVVAGSCNAFAIHMNGKTYYSDKKIVEVVLLIVFFLGTLTIFIAFCVRDIKKPPSLRKRTAELEKELAELKTQKKDGE